MSEDVRTKEQRRRTEEDLRFASLYARSLIEASLDPLVTISAEGKITDVNAATEQATGMPRGVLIGSDFSDYFTEPERARAGYRQALAEGLVRDYPLTIRHKSGHTIDVLYNATVYRNEAGEVQGVFAAARDVTERKRAEEELRRTSLYARSLIEASLDPLVTISAEGKITDVNAATEQATGMPREVLIGSDFSDYFTEPERARAGYRQALAEGLVRDYPLTIRHKSGHTIDVLYNATVYRNEAGEVQGVFAAARDVTERKRAEEALQQANVELEERIAERTAELRTSNESLRQEIIEGARVEEQLKALNETLEDRVAERTAIAEQRATQLRELALELTQAEQRERRRLARVLHDNLQQLLAAARIQIEVLKQRARDEVLREPLRQIEELLAQSIQASRSLTIELSPPALYDLGLAPALLWLAHWMQEKQGLTVETELDEQSRRIPEDVRVLLFQSVRELLFNVVKHAEVNCARLCLKWIDENRVQITVADRGVGFDPKHRLLEEGRTLGEGFGLFSVQERIHSLGGHLEVQSAPGQGTQITVRVPVEQSIQPSAAQAATIAIPVEKLPQTVSPETDSAAVARIRIMLVDDRQIVREGLASLLRKEPDFEIVGEAVDGQHALELVQQTQPDVVVMDVTMPRLNGIEATRAIIAAHPHIRIIGLSMHAQEGLAMAMRRAGAAAYLTKDGPSEELITAIRAGRKRTS